MKDFNNKCVKMSKNQGNRVLYSVSWNPLFTSMTSQEWEREWVWCSGSLLNGKHKAMDNQVMTILLVLCMETFKTHLK